jgi:hypothetical protein
MRIPQSSFVVPAVPLLSDQRSAAALLRIGRDWLAAGGGLDSMKVVGSVLLILGAFATFAVASTYPSWRPIGIVLMIGGLVALVAGYAPSD